MALLTPWGEKLNRELPLDEYPRMQFQRGSFMNLNGTWEFQITDGSLPDPVEGWEKITVPFALGSYLSGTDRNLKPDEVLWYRRTFEYTPSLKHVRLNFEAVDQFCTVYVNGIEAGSHAGGYAPFSLDITGLVKEHNELVVRCEDHTDQGPYVYGKQSTHPEGIWYTPGAGIWQTVWLEEVPAHPIEDIQITPDPENGQV